MTDYTNIFEKLEKGIDTGFEKIQTFLEKGVGIVSWETFQNEEKRIIEKNKSYIPTLLKKIEKYGKESDNNNWKQDSGFIFSTVSDILKNEYQDALKASYLAIEGPELERMCESYILGKHIFESYQKLDEPSKIKQKTTQPTKAQKPSAPKDAYDSLDSETRRKIINDLYQRQMTAQQNGATTKA